jgi:nucleotide-binding universal stress UspA family protein
MTFASILVPVDGSTSADGALRLALRLAAPDGEIVIAHVIDRAAVVAECVTPYGGDATPALEALEADERDIFASAVARARAANVRASTVALDGSAVGCIIRLARERGIKAIAMGTHGRHGVARLFLGNTAAGVVRETDVPTFVVNERNAERAEAPFKHIAIAFDSSPASRAAARAAVDLAAHDGGRIFFARIGGAAAGDGADDRAYSEISAYVLSSGVPSDGAVLHGDPLTAILDCAAVDHADLVVIGGHRRGEPDSPLGSEVESVVRTSPIPVLVVPSAAAGIPAVSR